MTIIQISRVACLEAIIMVFEFDTKKGDTTFMQVTP